PRPNYAQEPSGHEDPGPAERSGAHIRTPVRPVGPPGDGRSGAVVDARIAAPVLPGGAWEPSPGLPLPPAAQGQPRPVFASASYAAFRDDRPRVHHAGPEFHFVPAGVIRRFAASAACGRSVPARVECMPRAFEAPRWALPIVPARIVTV